jgi:hypothetical protein
VNSLNIFLTSKVKQIIVMLGFPRQPIKYEGCGEEGDSTRRRDEKEMKGNIRDKSSKK